MKIKCTCKHAFQDGEYGQGIRVVTPIDKSKHPQTHKIQRVRCTACGKEHDAPNAKVSRGAEAPDESAHGATSARPLG